MVGMGAVLPDVGGDQLAVAGAGERVRAGDGVDQWYEYTGTLGGSLWIWAVNLSVYGILMSMGSGRWRRFNWKRASLRWGYPGSSVGPLVLSGALLARERRALDSGIEPGAREQLVLGAGTEPGARFPESLAVVIAQPNFDPYHKFEAMTQAEQTAVLVAQFDDALQNFPPRDSVATPVLLIGPETFTNDILVGDIHASPTYQHFRAFLARHPEANLLFGASTYELIGKFFPPFPYGSPPRGRPVVRVPQLRPYDRHQRTRGHIP